MEEREKRGREGKMENDEQSIMSGLM